MHIRIVLWVNFGQLLTFLVFIFIVFCFAVCPLPKEIKQLFLVGFMAARDCSYCSGRVIQVGELRESI